MYSTVQGELIYIAVSIGVGAVMAFLYDVIRISRRIVKVNAPVVCGEDILFFAVVAVVFFCVAYVKNKGELRVSGIIGGAGGIFTYAYIVRNRVVVAGTAVLNWLIKSAIMLLRVMMFPVRIVLRVLKKPVDIVVWYSGRGMKRVKRLAKCGKARAKMRLLAARALVKKK